jgi:hypothetical protein
MSQMIQEIRDKGCQSETPRERARGQGKTGRGDRSDDESVGRESETGQKEQSWRAGRKSKQCTELLHCCARARLEA